MTDPRPTIVLIPGLMNDAAVWRAQLPALSRRAPVHIACNDGFDSLAEMAHAILAATSGPIAVVGHSMGGRVALEVAAAAPDRVARLALLSTGANGPQPEEAATRGRLVDLAHAEGMEAVIDAWLPAMIAPDADPAARAATVAMLRRADPDILARQQRALLTRTDRAGLLGTIACPTLVATGAKDGWSTPASHEAMAAAIPGATLKIVPDSAHMLPIEAADALTDALLAWLEG